MVEPYKQLYTVKEAAEVLRTSTNEVYALMNSGELPYFILRSRKIRGIDLENYINTRPLEAPEGRNNFERQAVVHI